MGFFSVRAGRSPYIRKFCWLNLNGLCVISLGDVLTDLVTSSGSNGYSGGSNGYSNGYSNGSNYGGASNGYGGGASYGGAGSYGGGAGGDKMSNLGAGLKTQHWGKSLLTLQHCPGIDVNLQTLLRCQNLKSPFTRRIL